MSTKWLIGLVMVTALSAGCDSTPSTRPLVDLLPPGLEVRDIVVGTGRLAWPGRLLTVHYELFLEDSTKIDSSIDRGQGFTFQLGAGHVIQGWEKGIPGMRVGGIRWLSIPPELAYGAQGTPGGPIPPNATLLCTVSLLRVTDPTTNSSVHPPMGIR